MQITELQLINFGKFSDYSIKIKDGFNVIYGDNEAGKSTVALFVKLMFYGIPTSRTKSGELAERTRIIPWNGSKASGRMKLTDGHRNIEIYREFGKRSNSDTVSVTDSDTGENYFGTPVKSEEVGERLLGMSRGMFERTLWIGQNDVCMSGKNDEITARLMNFLDSGSETDVSINDAINRIEKKELSLKAKTKRNSKGEIDVLIEERDSLSAELADIVRQKSQRQADVESLAMLEKRSAEIDKEIEALNNSLHLKFASEKIKRVERLDSCMRREMQLANTRMFQLFKHKISDEAVECIESDYSRIDALEVTAYEQSEKLGECERIMDKHKKSAFQKRIFGAVLLILAITACVLCFSLGAAKPFGFSFSGAAVILAALYTVIISASNRKISELSEEIRGISEALDKTRGEISDAENRLSQSLKEFECESYSDFKEKLGIYSEDKAKIKVCRDIYAEELGDDDYSELKKEADDLRKSAAGVLTEDEAEIQARLKAAEAERSRILSETISLKHRLDESGAKALSELDINGRIRDIDEDVSEKQSELAAVRLAADCLKQAYSNVKSDFTPQLNRETLKLLQRMTGGRHEKITIADDFSMNLNEAGDSGEAKRAEFFSIGTYNQLYFALRLAIARLTVEDDKRNLYLDDLLITFDDDRAKKTMDMLESMCREENIQIILFTCHGRDKEYADNTIIIQKT